MFAGSLEKQSGKQKVSKIRKFWSRIKGMLTRSTEPTGEQQTLARIRQIEEQLKEQDEFRNFRQNLFELSEMRSASNALSTAKICKTCKILNANRLILPCGHLTSCEFCINLVSKCPTCDLKIENILNVHGT